MPELPEVETIKRELSRALPGRKITDVKVAHLKMVSPLSAPKFSGALVGKKIKAVERRAKMLLLSLEKSGYLAIHLKMTGQLIYRSDKKLVVGGHPQRGGLDDLPNKFTHIIFYFDDGSTLFFNDMRRFGWARVYDESGLAHATAHLGIEPLAKEFTLDLFNSMLKRYAARPLKLLLLDQTIIAGIGNIYADESCFLARVLPTRASGSLSKREVAALYRGIIDVLKLSIKHKGTSAKNYVTSTGTKGGFMPFLNVYGRSRAACKRCGTPIEKIKYRGRGTHFCPKCQK